MRSGYSTIGGGWPAFAPRPVAGTGDAEPAPLLERLLPESVHPRCTLPRSRHLPVIAARPPAWGELRYLGVGITGAGPSIGESGPVIDDAAPPSGDLLVQAVEGMDRPLFVLDEDWRFAYINAAGARALDRTVDVSCSAARCGRSSRRRSAGRSSGCTETSARPAAAAIPRRSSIRSVSGSAPTPSSPTAGLVVTFDDVTERRRIEDERAAAVTAREQAAAEAARAAAEAELAGRHLMLLGDINLAMTSTLDTDEAVDRFAHLVVPLLADWCLVSVVDPDGTRRDVGRAHSDPAMVEAMHRYADRARGDQPGDARRCPRCCATAGRLSSRSSPMRTSTRWSAIRRGPRGAGSPPALRRGHLPADRAGRAVRRRSRSSTEPSAARTPRPSCGRRRSPPAGRRSPWTTPGWPRPTSRWPSACS